MTDLDGRTQPYDLPMIYIDNTLLPAKHGDRGRHVQESERRHGMRPSPSRRQAEFKRQRVAFAQSVKAGDTSVQVDTIGFSARGRGQQSDAARLQRQSDAANFLSEGRGGVGAHRGAGAS